MTQAEALDILKMGRNVFITGPAGSGKTYVINKYIDYLKEHGVPLGITASTGIAATHMGGVTIHSWSGMGIKNDLSDHDLESLAQNSQKARRIKEAQVLIIDEVSMLHHFRLDTLNTITQYIRKNREPFGGLQIVLCGDFFQLPPVSKYGEPDTHFIYRSEAWRDGKFTVCYLSQNYRQSDDVSLSILNEIRAGEVSEKSRELLKSRQKKVQSSKLKVKSEEHTEDSEETIDIGVSEVLIEPTRLYTHNIDVDEVNQRELEKVAGHTYAYEMTSRGRKPLVDALKKSCLAPEQLRLKKGARVMCVKNNFETGYVNGTLGVVVSCGHGVDPVIRTAGSREFPDGRLITIEPTEWSIEDDGRVLAEITQYPLRLAWALTVHKSQGMSLDAIEVDLSKSFEPGMGYVALSRVRTLAGLSILGINEHALKVHPEVLEYDHHLRELSAKAESVISHADRSEITKTQEEFLARVAPMHAMQGKKGKGRGARTRSVRISTYAQTAKLIHGNKSLKEIAGIRDMTIDTIISHIEEIFSVGDTEKGEDLSQKDIAYLKYEISPQHFSKIEKALEEVYEKQTDEKPPLMSPVKTKVGNNISFRDIRLARVLLGYFKRKNNDTEHEKGVLEEVREEPF